MTLSAPSQGGQHPMIERGHSVPHFTVELIDGTPCAYTSIWQHRNLALVALDPDERDDSARYAEAVAAQAAAIRDAEAELVLTYDRIPGIPTPAVVVADRWGEVQFVASAPRAADLPSPDEIVAWLEFVQVRCPECEGEWR